MALPICLAAGAVISFIYFDEKHATAFVAMISTITSTVYATILLWDRISDRPRLVTNNKDIRIMLYSGEKFFRLDVGLDNRGRKDAENIRARGKIESLQTHESVEIDRVTWGKYVLSGNRMKSEYVLRSGDSAYMHLAWEDVVNKNHQMSRLGEYLVTFKAMARGTGRSTAKFVIRLPQDMKRLDEYRLLWFGFLSKTRMGFNEVTLESERSRGFLDQTVVRCARAKADC